MGVFQMLMYTYIHTYIAMDIKLAQDLSIV